MSDKVSDIVKRRFWRPRFSLWAMLVLVTVVAIPLGYIAQRRAWNLRRKAAYERLESKGFQFSGPESPTGGGTGKPAPLSFFEQWRRRIFLDKSTPPVESAALRADWGEEDFARAISDDDLAQLAYFPELEKLGLRGNTKTSHIQGAFLEKLAGAPKLAWLHLEGLDHFEGHYLRSLSRFPKLWSLAIVGCAKINDETLKHVEFPPSVKVLELTNCHLGDDRLIRWLNTAQLDDLDLNTRISNRIAPALAKQTSLMSLTIQNAPLSDEDLKCLASLRALQDLELTGMPLDGSFLKSLRAEQSLKRLDLSATPLADEFLPEIIRFKNLRMVNLAWTTLDGSGFENHLEWPLADGLHLTGAEFSPAGRAALAKIRGPKVVGLPWNWSPSDCAAFPNGKPAYDVSENGLLADQLTGIPSSKIVWSGDVYRFPVCNRAPKEKMAAVSALLKQRQEELARRQEKARRQRGER